MPGNSARNRLIEIVKEFQAGKVKKKELLTAIEAAEEEKEGIEHWKKTEENRIEKAKKRGEDPFKYNTVLDPEGSDAALTAAAAAAPTAGATAPTKKNSTGGARKKRRSRRSKRRRRKTKSKRKRSRK